MSSFSSVVRKPGQKFAPKAAPRRNVPRRNGPLSPALTPEVLSASQEPSQIESGSSSKESYERARKSTSHSRAENHKDATQDVPIPTPPSTYPDTTQSRAQAVQDDVQSRHEAGSSGRRVTRSKNQEISRELPIIRQQVQTPVTTQIDSNGTQDATTNGQNKIIRPATTSKLASPVTKRKRKSTPRAGAGLILTQPTNITPPTTRQSASSERSRSETSRQASFRESIEHATEQAAAVAELAQSIGSGDVKRRKLQTLANSEHTENRGEQNKKRQTKKSQSHLASVEQQAAEVIANVTGETDLLPRRRGATPDELEQHVIEEEATTMAELCRDNRWGTKSKTEKEMRENWPEIVKRRREAKILALEDALNSRKRTHVRDKPVESALIQMAQHTVEMDIVNGNIVALSREIDREELLNKQIEETVEVLEDKDIYKRVNQSTVGIKNHLPQGQNWDDSSTELFYQGLSMFGTDFMMISNMIPGKTRKQVKLKYNVEERMNWPRVRRKLAEQQAVDLGQYSQMTGLAFGNATDVYNQMKEDEKRLREEDEQRRRDEGIVQHDADVPLQSIEGDGTEGPEGTAERSTRDSRLDSAARQVVERATKKRQPRKTNASTSTRRGRQATSKAAAVEGTEERLGTIEEVAV